MPHQWPHPGETDVEQGAGQPAPPTNQIVEVKLTLRKDLPKPRWLVEVTKEFAPEHGGGTQVFSEPGGLSVHFALDMARRMVTVSPGQRTDTPAKADEERIATLRKDIAGALAKIERLRANDDGTDPTVNHRIDVCNDRVAEWSQELAKLEAGQARHTCEHLKGWPLTQLLPHCECGKGGQE